VFERKAVLEFASDIPQAVAPDLRAAYQTCREITRIASKTFYLASLFLGAEKRRAVWAVYAFCRTADDVVERADLHRVRGRRAPLRHSARTGAESAPRRAHGHHDPALRDLRRTL
jgi:phytoene synthase